VSARYRGDEIPNPVLVDRHIHVAARLERGAGDGTAGHAEQAGDRPGDDAAPDDHRFRGRCPVCGRHRRSGRRFATPNEAFSYVGIAWEHMTTRLQVLYVGDDSGEGFAVEDLHVRRTRTVSEALETVETVPVDCVVSEQRLADGSGLDLLRTLRAENPDLPFVLYPSADVADESVASEAISAGVTDYYRQDETTETDLAYVVLESASGTRRIAKPGNSPGEVLERVSDGFLALDTEWRLTHHNERAKELIDVDAGEVIGENVWDEFPEATERAFYEEYHRAMETQETVSFMEYFPPLETWFEVTAYPSETGLSVYFRDVTERVERERDLERYERIVETVEDGVYALDPEGRIAFVNEQFAALYGRPREELLGEPATLVHGEEIADRATEYAAEIAAGERDQGIIEHEFQTADGDSIPVEVRFSILEYGDGEYGRVGVVRDITERVEREQDLKRYEVLMEESTDVNVVLDEDGTFRYLTPSVERVLGYEPAELVGESVFDYIHPDDRDDIKTVFFDSHETADRPTREFRFARADGSWAVIEASGRNLLDDPDINGIVVYTRDITERVEREHELETTADAFHGLVEAVSDRDADFGTKVERLLDLGREYLGVDLGFLTRVEDDIRTVAHVRGDHPRLQEGDRAPLEESYCRFTLDADGHWEVNDAVEAGLSDDPVYKMYGLGCYVAGTVTVGGDRYGTLCFADESPRAPFTDVEAALVDLLAQWVGFEFERRTLESERERLAFLNRLVRHDLLNDLTVVHARSKLLDGEVAESQQPHLDLVVDRSEKMIDLVGTVHSLTQAVVDEQALDSVGLVEVLQQEVEAVDHANDRAEVRFDGPTGVEVRADALLGEVFENLLVNAVEHGATGGEPPDPLVEVRVVPDEEFVTVHVADDGPGLPDDLKDHVFERGTTGTESRGTGIGLSLVAELVDAYGGSVSVADNEPTGTVFSVRLPRA